MQARQAAVLQNVALACAATLWLAGCDGRQEAVAAPVATTTVGNEIDDSVVTTRVKSALLGDSEVKSMDIKVETRKGKVQLSGFVDTAALMESAIARTRKVEGVKSVENAMMLKTGTATVGNTIDDSVLTARVKSALLSDPDVKSSDIAVVTRKGQVQLSGYVDSQKQISRAIDVTRSVEGVQSVGNEMSIKK